ncbi:MAG: carboxymuconolactone decarboxylase family protein [Parvibaculum sp.]
MARLSPLDREQLTDLAPMLELVEASMGFVPNSLLIMARKPALVGAFAGLSVAVMQNSQLPEGLSSLVAFVVSRSAGCQYCQAHTHHQAARAGLPDEKLDDIWNYERSELFSDAERAALRVAQSAAVVPNAVTDEDFAQLHEHFSEDQIVEIISIISFFGFLNRWNDTLATPLEDEPLDHAQTNLSNIGWTAGKHG